MPVSHRRGQAAAAANGAGSTGGEEETAAAPRLRVDDEREKNGGAFAFSSSFFLRCPSKTSAKLVVILLALLALAAVAFLASSLSPFDNNRIGDLNVLLGNLATATQKEPNPSVVQIRRPLPPPTPVGAFPSAGTVVVAFSGPPETSSSSLPTSSTNGAVLVGPGPHSIDVVVDRCTRGSAAFWVRAAGNALVAIRLVETFNRNGNGNGNEIAVWRGTFDLPLDGPYRLDFRWYGCREVIEPEALAGTTNGWVPLSEPVEFIAVGCNIDITIARQQQQQQQSPSPVLPSPSAWLSPSLLFERRSVWLRTASAKEWATTAPSSSTGPGGALPSYLWTYPGSSPSEGKLLSTNPSYSSSSSTTTNITTPILLSTEGTLRHPYDYYDFRKLSNYELVW